MMMMMINTVPPGYDWHRTESTGYNSSIADINTVLPGYDWHCTECTGYNSSIADSTHGPASITVVYALLIKLNFCLNMG